MDSRHDFIRGISCHDSGLFRPHCELSVSTHIVTVILSKPPDTTTLLFSESTVSCQSPQVQLR